MKLPSNPYILLSFINTKLRDFYSSLDELVEDFDYDKNEIIERLDEIGYHYDEKLNKLENKLQELIQENRSKS